MVPYLFPCVRCTLHSNLLLSMHICFQKGCETNRRYIGIYFRKLGKRGIPKLIMKIQERKRKTNVAFRGICGGRTLNIFHCQGIGPYLLVRCVGQGVWLSYEHITAREQQGRRRLGRSSIAL